MGDAILLWPVENNGRDWREEAKDEVCATNDARLHQEAGSGGGMALGGPGWQRSSSDGSRHPPLWHE